ncbi:hypothetical protein [Nonomuraea longispora]|uniref:hypothetical protein n=1 Tax=Nonomuraea longispora TaxID=1848320 RepID=UPI001C6FF961|nr:hypothetical protein [Nonomuraea longispora]
MDEYAIAPQAVARAVAFAIEQPPDVEIGEIVIRPTTQKVSRSPVQAGLAPPEATTNNSAAGQRVVCLHCHARW